MTKKLAVDSHQLAVGWQVKRLDEVCRVVNGGTPKTKVDEYWGGIHYWITPAEMGKRSSPFVSETKRTLTDAGLQKCSAQLVPSLSSILSTRAPIGHLVINTTPMAFNQGCRGLVPGDSLDYKFLHFFLLKSVGLLNDLGTGATFKELSAGKLKCVQIPLPSLPEQKRIVAILDEAFAGISQAVANAEKNLANARELFESYLNNVFTRKGDGWVEKRLKEFCDRVSVGHVGATTKYYCKKDEGIPFVRSQNVRPKQLDLSGVRYITPAFHNKLKKSKLEPGDLLFVRVGANRGDCCAVPENIEEMNCANIVFARTISERVRFVEYFCYSPIGQQQLLGMTTGSAQGVINTKSVAELLIFLPSVEEQDRIVQKIDSFSSKITDLETIYQQKLTALAELKQSILQKAFSGELTSTTNTHTKIPHDA